MRRVRARQADWTVRVRLWVERDGEAVLGHGRVELLEAIDRTRSISAAARALNMSYRRAWQLVQRTNRAAGVPLVEAAVGGAHGGGARLTDEGRQGIGAFHALEERLRKVAADNA
jgi:molybdate transport system regulatory protein